MDGIFFLIHFRRNLHVPQKTPVEGLSFRQLGGHVVVFFLFLHCLLLLVA